MIASKSNGGKIGHDINKQSLGIFDTREKVDWYWQQTMYCCLIPSDNMYTNKKRLVSIKCKFQLCQMAVIDGHTSRTVEITMKQCFVRHCTLICLHRVTLNSSLPPGNSGIKSLESIYRVISLKES